MLVCQFITICKFAFIILLFSVNQSGFISDRNVHSKYVIIITTTRKPS